ncbi:helix-turn-helix domain-containing protein [Roseateles sp.]|uniref:helix-turn-helix domain-containing protein n=1 Tax=Roseateles sp. TaxID=1971397 RepID=UPI0032657D0D
MHKPAPETADDDLMDAAQVAGLCGVKASTVARWRSRARAQPLAFHKIGGRCLYRRTDVQAFVAAGRQVPVKA